MISELIWTGAYVVLKLVCISFSTDGAFPDVQDADSIRADTPQYYQTPTLKVSTDKKPDGPSSL